MKGDTMADRKSITTDIILDICERVANGQTLTAAAKEHGTSSSAVRYQLMKDEELFSHSARARELGCDALADECIAIADDPLIDPADKRIRIDTRIRLIGKWSQRYSDKLTVKNETTVTHRYDLDRLGTDRLEQLESILADAARSESGAGEAKPASLH